MMLIAINYSLFEVGGTPMSCHFVGTSYTVVSYLLRAISGDMAIFKQCAVGGERNCIFSALTLVQSQCPSMQCYCTSIPQ